MKISPTAALLALTRDPLSLLNLMFFSQACAQWSSGVLTYWMLPFLLLGYFSQVLKGAILADQAQLPQARDFKSAMGLGCMGTFFLVAIGFITWAVIMISGFPPDELTTLSNFTSVKSPYFLGSVLPLWFFTAIWSGLIYAHYTGERDVDRGNQMMIASFKIFFRPPLSRDGLLMLALCGAVLASQYLPGGWLGPTIPLCFLLSHCLGQYLRKVRGFRLG